MNSSFNRLLTGALLLACNNAIAQNFGTAMPPEPAPGMRFPAAETTVNTWVFGPSPDWQEIYRHGWGIWAGLTTATGQTAFGIRNALVYQTWLSPQAIIKLMNQTGRKPGLHLRTPRQHLRGGAGPELLSSPATTPSGLQIDYAVAETVGYSPSSARHAYSNRLLWKETLDTLVRNGYTELPPFPNDSVNIKPVYKLISSAKTNGDKKLYAMPAWPGTPNTESWSAAQKKQGFPNKQWQQCTYIDVSNKGTSSARGVDRTCFKPSPDNTYGVGDFISITVTESDQAYFESLIGTPKSGHLAVGDILILVGMHVTTRETERWTWQTFWWAADPANPNTPSSREIAKNRPSTLQGAAAHYAMATAYSMLSPAQPLVGGDNAGSLVPAYNPHLEAGFGTGTFGLTRTVQTPSGPKTTDLGVQSNCMSCHGMAGYATNNSPYISNFYLPLDDPSFSGGMKTDFAWSIVDEAVARPVSHEK